MWRKEGIFRVSDLAVMKIIQDNYGSRPIYFAVTCETYVGFEKYARNEGMVSRIVPTNGSDQLDIDRLLNNTDKVYSYRSIKDKRVYKDDNMRRLIMNYGAAYDRASSFFLEKGENQKAREYLDSAFVFITSEFSKDIRLVNILLQTGQYDEAHTVTTRMLSKKQDEMDNFLFLVKLWVYHNADVTYEILQAAIKQYPNDPDLAYITYDVGLELRTFKKSRETIQMMNPSLVEMFSPYLDTLRMYEQYLGGLPESTVFEK
jgi:tetratricopeptide (TPR) repeat protein